MFLCRLLALGKRINVLGSKNTISISPVATNEFYPENTSYQIYDILRILL